MGDKMATDSYEPRVGDTVSVQGHHGTFEIVQVYPCIDNWHLPQEYGSVDVEEVKTRSRLKNIPWAALEMQEIIARRILERLRAENRFPQTVMDFEIESGADHEDNPALYVTFFVRPDESRSAIEELRRFRETVEVSLREESLLNWWPYIQFSASRSSLDVAS
jgi:hypothetical protein